MRKTMIKIFKTIIREEKKKIREKLLTEDKKNQDEAEEEMN